MKNIGKHFLKPKISIISHYRIFSLMSMLSACFISRANAQGIINDNATIYMTGSSCIYIDGATGHFTNQNSGQITAGTTDTIKVTGNWYNNTNNRVFTSNGGVTSLQGTSQTIGGSYATSFYSLKLSGSGTKTLAQDISVGGGYASPGGNLDLASLPLALNQHTLTITNPTDGDSTNGAIRFSTGSVISEQNAAINTSIIKWQMGGASNTGNHIFPFGYTDGTQIPVRFNISSSANTDISISTRANSNSCAPNPPGSCNQPWQSTVTEMYGQNTGTDVSVQAVIDRWWQIDASVAAVADVTLTYRGTENSTSNPAGVFKIQRWGGTGWNTPVGMGSTGVTSGTGTVSAAGVSSWGPIVITYASNPLPVELLSFNAQCYGTNVEVKWTTASEINNNYFTVQRSADGLHFENADHIKGAGSSTNTINYIWIDEKPKAGYSYYRLEQTDMNGEIKSFAPENVYCEFSNNQAADLLVYPNPFVNELNISFKEKIKQGTVFEILDNMGQVIYQKKIDSERSQMRVELQKKLPPGVYLIMLIDDTGITHRKPVKKL